jgi:hypothetical protein
MPAPNRGDPARPRNLVAHNRWRQHSTAPDASMLRNTQILAHIESRSGGFVS